MPEPTHDRRTALKERHRAAILVAAAELIDETGGVHFTMEELARRADVSRRTVFNHFASVDDILTGVFADVLATLVDHYDQRLARSPELGGGTGSMFAELADAFRTTDLVTPMAYLTRCLGGTELTSPWLATALVRVLDDLSRRLADRMAAQHPDVDVLQVHLLVNAVISGLVVLHAHWYEATDGADDERSREVWDRLLDRLLEGVQHGHATNPDRPTRP